MRTKEFIQKMKNEGYQLSKSSITSDFRIFINEDLVGYVTQDERFAMSIIVAGLLSEKAFAFIVAYASTPVEKREEPKRWRLKANLPAVSETYYNEEIYLNKNRESGKTILSSCADSRDWKTIFTEEDLKDINETGFKRIPVEEGEW